MNYSRARTVCGDFVCGVTEDLQPSFAIAVPHIVFAGLGIVCGVWFIVNAARSSRLIRVLLSKKKSKGDVLAFYLAPMLCVIFGLCTLIAGLSAVPWTDDSRCCIAPLSLQKVRWILHSFIVPGIIHVSFEQSYIVHKRKTANFCWIKFDSGRRSESSRCSLVMRNLMRLCACALCVFNIVMNAFLMHDVESALQQERFTSRAMLYEAKLGDWPEFIVMVICLSYFSLALWRYGTHYSMNITATYCNIWASQFLGTILLAVGQLLPPHISVIATDATIVFYLFTMLTLQGEVSGDLKLQINFRRISQGQR